MSITIILA